MITLLRMTFHDISYFIYIYIYIYAFLFHFLKGFALFRLSVPPSYGLFSIVTSEEIISDMKGTDESVRQTTNNGTIHSAVCIISNKDPG